MIPDQKTPIWDISLRLFHWSLVLLIALSWYSGEQDKFGIWADVHLWSGYGVIVLIIWRILWGLFGSDTARFSLFIKGPAAVKAYLKGAQQKHAGHNPLGAFSVLILLALPLVIALLGLFSSDGMFFEGPFAGENGGEIKGIHRQLGEILYWIVGLHVVAVLWYWIGKKINLLLPMITGKKLLQSGVEKPALKPTWLALLLLVLVAGAAYWVIFGH